MRKHRCPGGVKVARSPGMSEVSGSIHMSGLCFLLIYDDDEFVFAREVQFPHGAYKEKEKTKRKGTKETITKGHPEKNLRYMLSQSLSLVLYTTMQKSSSSSTSLCWPTRT